MAQVLVRGLDDELLKRLKAQAKEHNRSLEAELREIIESSVKYTPREFVEISRKLRERFKGRMFSDSTELIREDRDR
jgi:plasmid stability protein